MTTTGRVEDMKCRIYWVKEWKSWALTVYDENDIPQDQESEYFHYKRDALKRARELKRTEGIDLAEE